MTRKDAYPLSYMDDVLELLQGATTLDLTSGYWQVEVGEQDHPKTAFCMHQGIYQFWVIPFGLCNAPSTFERLLDAVLEGLLGDGCLVYLDDIITYGHSFDQCLERLVGVLQKLGEAGLRLKPSKCQLFECLGHVVSGSGIATDPELCGGRKELPWFLLLLPELCPEFCNGLSPNNPAHGEVHQVRMDGRVPKGFCAAEGGPVLCPSTGLPGPGGGDAVGHGCLHHWGRSSAQLTRPGRKGVGCRICYPRPEPTGEKLLCDAIGFVGHYISEVIVQKFHPIWLGLN